MLKVWAKKLESEFYTIKIIMSEVMLLYYKTFWYVIWWISKAIGSAIFVLADIESLTQMYNQYIVHPFKHEFTIVIFLHYKPRIAIAILDF